MDIQNEGHFLYCSKKPTKSFGLENVYSVCTLNLVRDGHYNGSHGPRGIGGFRYITGNFERNIQIIRKWLDKSFIEFSEPSDQRIGALENNSLCMFFFNGKDYNRISDLFRLKEATDL